MKNKVTLIGLVGLKQSGKDTACNFIGNFSKQPVIRRAFADALKKEVSEACGVQLHEVEDNKELFRPMLQWWGTEFRRGLFGKNYWLKRMPEPNPAFLTVITDVRFEDEAQWVRDRGGLLVRVVRPMQLNDDTHRSESEQAEILTDEMLLNRGGLPEFMHEIQVFMEEDVL